MTYLIILACETDNQAEAQRYGAEVAQWSEALHLEGVYQRNDLTQGTR